MSNGFHGIPTGTLSNGTIRLDYLTRDAVRIVRLLREPDGANLLAEAPDIDWSTPAGPYVLFGGHRIWHAPQQPFRTDIPNRGLVSVETLEHGVRLTQPVEPRTGVQKVLEIMLDAQGTGVRLRHRILNRNLWPIELAPWAITMMPLNGMVVLPMPNRPRDPAGQGPNRRIVYWPYTSLKDPRWIQNDRACFVRALPLERQWKVGYENTDGWIGYLRDGVFFLKRFAPAAGAAFADMGCNVEVYCNDRFVELETLGPLGSIQPGGEAAHEERWELHPGPAIGSESEAEPETEDLLEWISRVSFLNR